MATKKVNNPRFDAFVSALRPDPKSKGDPLIVVQGFIGKSSESKHIRVYFDEELSSFIDILETDIQYIVALPKEVSPAGGSKLWVSANALYTFGDPSAKTRPKASFLQGDVMRAYEQQYDKPVYQEEFTIRPSLQAGGCKSYNIPCQETSRTDCYCPITNVKTKPCFCVEVTKQGVGATCYISCKATCIISCNNTCRQTFCFTCWHTCGRTCDFTCNNATCRRTCFCEWQDQFTPTPYAQMQARGNNPAGATGFERFNPYTTPNRGM